MTDDQLIRHLAVESYRRVHTPTAIARILETEGERWFKERGFEYHGPIIREALAAIREAGYDIVKREVPAYDDVL